LSDYFIQFLGWLRLHELAGTWADVSGFVIAIFGFAITIANVKKTKEAALAAQQAAQAARDGIQLFDAIQDFSTAIAVLEEIKRTQRGTGISETLPDRYAAIRKQTRHVEGFVSSTIRSASCHHTECDRQPKDHGKSH
jgi:hypothetical protein